MKERLQIVVTTVVVFLLGLGVGVWTQRRGPMPPPPIRPMGEFFVHRGFGPPIPPPWIIGFGSGPSISPGQMRVRIEALHPQIEAFRGDVEAIEEGFRKQLDAILAPQQRRKLAEFEASARPLPTNLPVAAEDVAGEMPAPIPPPPLPGCAGEATNLFVPMIIYRPSLERVTAVLHLNPQQRDQLKTLMIDRRDRLLALVDKTPPPSFKLGAIFTESTSISASPAW
jgi:hypothetical protein